MKNVNPRSSPATNMVDLDSQGVGRFGFLLLVLISCISFVACLAYLAQAWEQIGVLLYDNTLFDMDARSRIELIESGQSIPNVIHPLFQAFGEASTSVLSIAVAPLMSLGLNSEGGRSATLLLLPVMAGVAAYLTFLVGRYAGLDRAAAYLLMLVYCFSFSTIIFGSIPEHYLINNVFLLLMLIFSFRAYHSRKKISKLLAFPIGVMMAGITITNIIPFAIILFVDELNYANTSRVKSALRIAAMSVACLALVLAIPFSQSVKDKKSTKRLDPVGWTEQYLAFSPFHIVKRAAGFPIAFADGFVASKLTVYEEAKPPMLRATLHVVPKNVWPFAKAFIVITFAAIGLWGWLRFGYKLTSPAGSSIAIIGFYYALLIVWGTEIFLYSQFWIAPALVLIAGLNYLLRPIIFKSILVGFIIVEFFLNTGQIRELLLVFS